MVSDEYGIIDFGEIDNSELIDFVTRRGDALTRPEKRVVSKIIQLLEDGEYDDGVEACDKHGCQYLTDIVIDEYSQLTQTVGNSVAADIYYE